MLCFTVGCSLDPFHPQRLLLGSTACAPRPLCRCLSHSVRSLHTSRIRWMLLPLCVVTGRNTCAKMIKVFHPISSHVSLNTRLALSWPQP